jgi:hypothetical protein
VTAPATPDFTLTVDPSELTLPRGSAVAVRVTAGIAERFFNDPIDLSINGLPAGVNAGFDGTPILPFGGSNLWLFIDSSIAPGTYPVMVTGTSGSLTHYRAFMLTVT